MAKARKLNRKYVWNICIRIPTSTSKTVHCPSFLKPLYDMIWDQALEGSGKEVEQLEPRKYWDEETEEEGDMVYGKSEIWDCAKTKRRVKMRFANRKIDKIPVFRLAYPGNSFEREFAECVSHYSTDLIAPKALSRKQFEGQSELAAQEADEEASKAIEKANREAEAIASEAGIDLEQEDAEDELGSLMNESIDEFDDEAIGSLPILGKKPDVVETMKELGFDNISGLALATVKQLTSIHGIGEATAALIISQSQDALPDKQYT